MKPLLFGVFLLFALSNLNTETVTWEPPRGNTQVEIWPEAVPDAQPLPGPESAKTEKESLVAGKLWISVSNVSRPAMTIYEPKGKNTGVAMVVFPGGGFQVLAIDLEGTEVCDWLTARGITCVLLKYRVPSTPFDWRCNCRPDAYAISTQALEDAQRTVGLVRSQAATWHIDPHKIGVIGFSAGGYMVAEISNSFDRRLYSAVDKADKASCRPDFAGAIYPGHLAEHNGFNSHLTITGHAPPTFLVQAEDDHTDRVEDSLAYYRALKDAGVPVEMHLYAQGGHAFGLRRTNFPITQWPGLVEKWLATIGMVSE